MPLHHHLRQFERHLDDIFDVLNDGVYITDNEGYTLKVNTVYEKLTGLNRRELLGRRVGDLLEDGTFSAVLNPQIVDTGRSATVVQETRDGRRLVLSGHPIKGHDGIVSLVVTFVRDITVIGSLREQVSRQRQLIDSLSSTFKENHPALVVSDTMKKLVFTLHSVAETDATVLLLGETGVGKDVFARQVHANSPRWEKPFFKVDCTSIPENLIESELFGHVSGAFTGASKKGRIGYFEMAEGGTLFLDEIGELPLPMQAKLLRVLQDQEIMRVGDSRLSKVDVRIVAATNRSLEDEVNNGRFRSDLFYRLKVAELTIPPLRLRRDEILPLAELFLERFNHKHHKNKVLTDKARKRLAHHDWPGNVRELENMIQSVVVISHNDTIDAQDLPIATLAERTTLNLNLPDEEGRNLKELVNEYEYRLIQTALVKFGTLSRVAEYFGVDRSTIFRKLKHYERENSAA